MVIEREPVSEEVEREEPKREGIRKMRPVSDEELDVVPRIEKMRRRVLVREDWAGEEPRRGVVRWRMAEVVERGDVEPMKEKIEVRMLDVVERAEEEPDSVTSPTRERSPDVVEADGIVLDRESMVWRMEVSVEEPEGAPRSESSFERRLVVDEVAVQAATRGMKVDRVPVEVAEEANSVVRE